MSNGAGVLNEQHLQQIDNSLSQLAEAKQQLALAERAGFDVKSQQEQVASLQDRLRTIKQVYFPGR